MTRWLVWRHYRSTRGKSGRIAGRQNFGYPGWTQLSLGRLLAGVARQNLGAIIQLITGHCWLHRHTALLENAHGDLEILAEACDLRLCNVAPNSADDM